MRLSALSAKLPTRLPDWNTTPECCLPSMLKLVSKPWPGAALSISGQDTDLSWLALLLRMARPPPLASGHRLLVRSLKALQMAVESRRMVYLDKGEFALSKRGCVHYVIMFLKHCVKWDQISPGIGSWREHPRGRTGITNRMPSGTPKDEIRFDHIRK